MRPAVLVKTSSISSLPALPWIWIGLASGTSLLKMDRRSSPALPWMTSGWLGSSGHSTLGSKPSLLKQGAPAMIVCGALSSNERYVFGSSHGWKVETSRLLPSAPWPR